MNKQLFFATLLLLTVGPSQSQVLSRGTPMPDFTLVASDGTTIRSSDLRGKVVVVNFFATWCGPCQRELPQMEEEIWNRYKNDRRFCLLVIGMGETNKSIADFKNENDLNLPMYADRPKRIYNLFAEKYVPCNFIIDENGTIVYSEVGYSPESFAELLQMLAKVL